MLGRQPTGGLTAQVGWLGLKVGSQLALPCIRQMNRWNSRSDFVTMTALQTSSWYYYYYYFFYPRKNEGGKKIKKSRKRFEVEN